MAYANANSISGGLAGEGTRSAESFATEVWGPAVEVALKDNAVLANIPNDLSAFVSGQGEKVHLPIVDQVTSGAKGEGEISWATGASDAGEESLDIDTHQFAAVVIEDVIKVQGNYDMMNLFAKELGYSLANNIESSLNTKLLESVSSSSGEINGINVTDMGTAADFPILMAAALAEDANPANWTIALNPTGYANMTKLTDLSLGTGAALGADFGKTGIVGKLFGMDVVLSSVLQSTAYDFDTSGGTDSLTPFGFLIHKSAMYMAYSLKPRLQAQYDVGHLGTKVVADVIYGCMVRNASSAGQKRVHLLY